MAIEDISKTAFVSNVVTSLLIFMIHLDIVRILKLQISRSAQVFPQTFNSLSQVRRSTYVNYGSTTTVVPTCTFSNKAITSSFRIRTQP